MCWVLLTGTRRPNPIIRVIILMVLVVGFVAFVMSKSRFVDGRQNIFGIMHSMTTLRENDSLTTANNRRYSTSDEMRYILYGVGDQFSPYDQQLVDYIRRHVSQPSLTRPRKLAKPRKTDRSQAGQAAFVDKLLSGRRGGFFIECGAADGEQFSNSLFFELERDWTGILIEANPYYHTELLVKNRRAYVLQACISPKRRPVTVRVQPAGVFSGISDRMHESLLAFVSSNKKPEVVVVCFPLNAIMAALDVSHVDYFSLDVEGPELEILRTVDWTRLHIDVITVEYRVNVGTNVAFTETLTKLKELRQFFRDTGIYREVAVLPPGNETLGLDVVFSRI